MAAKADQPGMTANGANVHEFVPRDVSFSNGQREVDIDHSPSVETLNALIQNIAGATMDEIDRVISELEGVRNMLRNEGDRVAREIAGYARLSHSATTALRIVGDSVKQLQGPANSRR
jgi:hypothetical protein